LAKGSSRSISHTASSLLARITWMLPLTWKLGSAGLREGDTRVGPPVREIEIGCQMG
jgi:hypothetical protein